MITRFPSSLWQTSAALVVADDGAPFALDPAYFPGEIEAVAAAWLAAGGEPGRGGVIFTHGDWDHVVGWQGFPGATRVGAPALAVRLRDRGAAIAADIAAFDGRWYIERPEPFALPALERTPADGEEIAPGVTAVLLGGHTTDGLGLCCRRDRVLVVGDHLSPCEVPFVNDSIPAYLETLARLARLLDTGAFDRVLPGHGAWLPAAHARAIADEDRRYLEALLAGGQAALPRAAGVPGMAEAHAANLRLTQGGR